MKRVILANSVSNRLDSRLDSMLQDFAQVTGQIDYNDIINFSRFATTENISDLKHWFRSLNKVCREYGGIDYYEAAEEYPVAAQYVKAITRIIKQNNDSVTSSSNISALLEDDIQELNECCESQLYETWDNYGVDNLNLQDVKGIVYDHVQYVISDLQDDEFSPSLVDAAKKQSKEFKDIIFEYIEDHYDDYEWQ